MSPSMPIHWPMTRGEDELSPRTLQNSSHDCGYALAHSLCQGLAYQKTRHRHSSMGVAALLSNNQHAQPLPYVGRPSDEVELHTRHLRRYA